MITFSRLKVKFGTEICLYAIRNLSAVLSMKRLE